MLDLAIVIPAYKIDFFRTTLDSITNQTCKDFNDYIGDDCSPADFKTLIAKYEDKINIIYRRFDENLGGKDLVGHWKRCIELTQGESWLWLFSNDDILGERCVNNIILYDNESTDGMHDQIVDFIKEGFVIYNTIYGSLQQYNAYNDALRRYGKKYKYLAFIDCDEFLFPVNHNDSLISVIDKFFEDDYNLGGVVVNWAMYGSCGFEKNQKVSLFKTFCTERTYQKGKVQML